MQTAQRHFHIENTPKDPFSQLAINKPTQQSSYESIRPVFRQQGRKLPRNGVDIGVNNGPFPPGKLRAKATAAQQDSAAKRAAVYCCSSQ